MVIWLLGISGAGKTTLGVRLFDYFSAQGQKCYLIDGDEVRSFFEGDLGYSVSDREMNVKRIIFGAYLLNKNDILTIVCNISPFEHLRTFARRKIEGYREIYLRKDIERSIANDVKGMYKNHTGKTGIVGLDMQFDEPLHSDLIIDVDDMSVEESFRKILAFLGEGV